MAPGKATIYAAPGLTFPTLDTVFTVLSHFVSQTKNSVRGISGAKRGSGHERRRNFGYGSGGGHRGGGG